MAITVVRLMMPAANTPNGKTLDGVMCRADLSPWVLVHLWGWDSPAKHVFYSSQQFLKLEWLGDAGSRTEFECLGSQRLIGLSAHQDKGCGVRSGFHIPQKSQ